jgi:hypothetical protein
VRNQFLRNAMSLRYGRSPNSAPFSSGAAIPTAMYFATMPATTTVEYCLEAIAEVHEALRRAASSGVVSYNVGSRGLVRYSIPDLKELLAVWKDELQNAYLAGMGSSIQSRRAVPCDV